MGGGGSYLTHSQRQTLQRTLLLVSPYIFILIKSFIFECKMLKVITISNLRRNKFAVAFTRSDADPDLDLFIPHPNQIDPQPGNT